MTTLQLPIFSTCKNPNTYSSISLRESFERIKNPSSFIKKKILDARQYPKGTEQYNIIKESMPTICWNATFKNNKRNTKNVDSLTNLIFIDIDDSTFDIDTLDKKYIYAYWKSFGGVGYSILVKCENLTINNFKESYLYIVNQLNINNFIDDKCIDITRQNVISYDNNIIINEKCFSFVAVDEINKNYPTYTKKKREEEYNKGGVVFSQPKEYIKNYRYNNIDEISSTKDFNGERVLYIPEGYQYIEANRFWGKNKNTKGNRHNMLVAFTNNFIWLNQNTEENIIYTKVCDANDHFSEPLPNSEVINIINSINKYLKNGTLNPIVSNKTKKFIWKYNETKEQKMIDVNNRLKEKCRDTSTQKINDAIESWDFKTNGKITKDKLVTISHMSYKTIHKYWVEFKEHVQSLNLNNK